ncbi:MAG: ATP-dependent sacrificial sulfur transferase LarE [Coriobacteriales bacterium]|jgi:uncharacterized protein|nr:ATP-dependent sacrificial sulfur transferase LarE [Coriobacteriales bacterium]
MPQKKLRQLRDGLKDLDSVAVAFSGGVDSTLLLYLAHEELGDRCVAITARSHSFPERELREAQGFCGERGITHLIVDSEELDIEGFSSNPPDRCYLCKRGLFEHIGKVVQERGLSWIVEGSNLDDEGDYRPGLVAVAEAGVRSPLREAGLTKAEVRALSRVLGLPTAEKPSFACLASRFPYGEHITAEGLTRVDRAEQLLLDEGLRQVRVRVHGDVARIETDEDGMTRLLEPGLRERVHEQLQALGFRFVSLDMRGYRTGSMNATLPE